MHDLDLTFVDRTVNEVGRGAEAVIPILQRLQDHYHYLPDEALRRVCELTDITPASITGVSTFYTQFRHRPVGQHIIQVCLGTGCHVKGAELVRNAFATALHLRNGQDTDRDGMFTLQPVACLGCCTLAPVVQIDDITYGRVTPRKVPAVLSDFLKHHDGAVRPLPRLHPAPAKLDGEIRIGMGSCCVAQGSAKVHDALDRIVTGAGMSACVKRVGCVGMCHQTPLVEIVPRAGSSSLYACVQPDDVESIVLRHFQPRGVLRRLGYTTRRWLDRLLTDEEEQEPAVQHAIDPRETPVCSFLGPQKHLATEYCGQLEPIGICNAGTSGWLGLSLRSPSRTANPWSTSLGLRRLSPSHAKLPAQPVKSISVFSMRHESHQPGHR